MAMNFKRLSRAAALTAAALVITSCGGGGGWGEPLSWRTSVDLPMNFSRDLNDDPEWLRLLESDGASQDGALLDLGTERFPIASDFMDAMKKTTDQQIGYSLRIFNGTGAALTFYGMLFRNGDGAADLDSADFYKLITSGGLPDRHQVNILGTDGLSVNPDDDALYDMPLERESTLCDLLTRESAIAWRWLVMVDNPIDGASTDTSAVIDIKLRIRFSGVNCFDSLVTL